MDPTTYRWRCACCGVDHRGLPMDIGFNAPAGWGRQPQSVRARSFLGNDFCVISYETGEVDRFIRCVLPLPAPELDGEFRFGVWCSVSKDSLAVYDAGVDSGAYAKEGCFGYLWNALPSFPDTTGLHADVAFGGDNQRPRTWLHDAQHPLVTAQRHGVDLETIKTWAEMMHKG